MNTSARMTAMIAADEWHAAAARTWAQLLASPELLITTNNILLETCTLLQRHHGVAYVRRLQAEALPVLEIVWITPEQHEAALASLLTANRGDLSLVDCTSFIVMRERAISRAFAVDPDFAEQGFELASCGVRPCGTSPDAGAMRWMMRTPAPGADSNAERVQRLADEAVPPSAGRVLLEEGHVQCLRPQSSSSP